MKSIELFSFDSSGSFFYQDGNSLKQGSLESVSIESSALAR